jgi:mannose-6-phosphate isomerase-like protein (cupin superfamily)
MKYGAFDIGGTIVKKDDRYIVKDNTELEHLIVSSTDLRSGKSTSGHKHEGQEEVYLFIRGNGQMELDNDRFDVYPGDTVLIKDGVFHRVHNTGEENLYFICVFEGKRTH